MGVSAPGRSIFRREAIMRSERRTAAYEALMVCRKLFPWRCRRFLPSRFTMPRTTLTVSAEADATLGAKICVHRLPTDFESLSEIRLRLTG